MDKQRGSEREREIMKERENTISIVGVCVCVRGGVCVCVTAQQSERDSWVDLILCVCERFGA